MRKSILILAMLLTAGTARAAGPATKPAAPPPDLSSPEKTWASVCAALKAEDLPAFRACFYNSNEISRLFMAAYSDITVTTFRLAKATALIGTQGKELSARLQSVYTDLVNSGKNRKTEIHLEEARWSRVEITDQGNAEEVMYFRKINGNWLIDTERSYALDSPEGRKAAEAFIANATTKTPMLKKIIADIQADKIRTLDELKTRMTGQPK